MLAVRLERLHSWIASSILEHRLYEHQSGVEAQKRKGKLYLCRGAEIGRPGEQAVVLTVSPDTLAGNSKAFRGRTHHVAEASAFTPSHIFLFNRRDINLAFPWSPAFDHF